MKPGIPSSLYSRSLLWFVSVMAAGCAAGPMPTPSISASTTNSSAFALASPAVKADGQLPMEYTGDGEAATLPLEWSHVPNGVKSFALIMHHVAPDKTKWYWILYNIPPATTRLPKNVQGIGTRGNNSVNGRAEYAPPHSKGPGPKTYILTLYALSAPLNLEADPARVNRDLLLAAMKDKILASAELRVVYTRNSPVSASNENRR